MQCPYCKQEHPAGLLYCPLTGKKISDAQEFFPPPEPVQPPRSPASRLRSARLVWLILAGGLICVVITGVVVYAILSRTLTPQVLTGVESTLRAATLPAATARPLATRPAAALTAAPVRAAANIPGRIAFETSRDGNLEIYVMNADGSGQIDLSRDPAEDSDPNWSADGSQIAFTTNRDGNWEIYVMNADGSHPVNLTNNPADDAYPSWSPDGQKIAFTTNRDGNLEIYVMNADGSQPVRLTNSEAKESFPDWSPDSQQIVYQSIGKDNYSHSVLYRINRYGSGKAEIGRAYDSSLYPAWSPDGHQIAFVSEQALGGEIYTQAIDGGQPVQLTQREPQSMISRDLRNSLPAWSPDGQYLAYASARDGNAEIYVMRADGSGPVNLTQHPGYDGFPDWAPLSGGPQLGAAAPTPAQPGAGLRGVKPDGSPIDANMACALHLLDQYWLMHNAAFAPEFALSCLEQDGWHVYKILKSDDPVQQAAWLARFLPRQWPLDAAPTQLPDWIAPCRNGRYYLLLDGRVFMLDGETPVEVTPDGYSDAELPVCGPDGDLWVRLAKPKPFSINNIPQTFDPKKEHVTDPDVGVSHLTGAVWTHYPAIQYFGSSKYVDWIESIAIAPDGTVWVATNRTIAAFDGARWKVYEGNRDFTERPILKMAVNSKGEVWVVTNTGLLAFDGQKWTAYEEGVPHYIYYAHQMVVDAHDQIWVAIDYQRQLYRFDPLANRWDLRAGEKEIGIDQIQGLQLDRQGRAWLSTGYGIYVDDGAKLSFYSMNTSGLYANGINSMLLFGDGPVLPSPVSQAPGSIQGRLLNPDPKVFEKLSMEICAAPVGGEYRGSRQCVQAQQAFHATAPISADGSFVFKDVPAGRYYILITSSEGNWMSDLWYEVKPGQATDTGQSNFPPDEEQNDGGLAPTPTPFTAPTLPTPSATPAPTSGPAPALSTAFRLVTHAPSFPVFNAAEVWLEFLIPPGQTLAGSIIESYLASGTLEILLPGGERLALPQVPSPSEITQLGGSTFENYGQQPAGPQIRIPIGELVPNPAQGRYQISWRSGNLSTNTINLDWNGTTLAVQP